MKNPQVSETTPNMQALSPQQIRLNSTSWEWTNAAQGRQMSVNTTSTMSPTKGILRERGKQP